MALCSRDVIEKVLCPRSHGIFLAVMSSSRVLTSDSLYYLLMTRCVVARGVSVLIN